MTHSSEVSWSLDGIEMFGTITRPDGQGPSPAVVLVAGSGPTDRNWESPLLPGANGSGRLLAEALAEAGFATIRYDKRASGPHVVENLPRLAGTFSMASHLAELEAAVGVLAADGAVDRSRIVGLGNSEGCLHVLRYADSAQEVPFAGVILAAPPGRGVGTVVESQLAAQLSAVPGSDGVLALVREAMARYAAGGSMDPDPGIPEAVRNVLLSFDSPVNLPFARELWQEGAADALARVPVPTLVLIGGKDLQIDQQADGDPLRAVADGNLGISFVFPRDANHVLKQDLRPRAEIVPGTGYNEDGTRLDPETMGTILDWLHRTVGE